MLIDTLLIICLLAGFFTGFRRGLIYSLFSFVAIFFGLMIALKYSFYMTQYLSRVEFISGNYLPLISFLLLLLLALALIKLISKAVEKIADILFLGIFNKLAGGALWAGIVALMFSTVLWYLDRMELISAEAKTTSYSYEYLIALSPRVIDFIAQLIPFFKGLFNQIEPLFREIPQPQEKGVMI